MDRGGDTKSAPRRGFVGLVTGVAGGGGPGNKIRGLGHSAAVRGASQSIPPGPCPARPYLPGSPCACTRRLQAHRARRRREPERKERQRVSNRGDEGGGDQGAGTRAGTLTRLGVKFPHAGGAAGGGVPKPCARPAGPAARHASLSSSWSSPEAERILKGRRDTILPPSPRPD